MSAPTPPQQPVAPQPVVPQPAVEYPPFAASARVEDPAPYHRLFRTAPGYAWWRPLVGAVLFAVFAGVALIVVSIIWIVLAFVLPLAGIVLGVIARGRVRRSGESGAGLATTAIVVGIILSIAGAAAVALAASVLLTTGRLIV